MSATLQDMKKIAQRTFLGDVGRSALGGIPAVAAPPGRRTKAWLGTVGRSVPAALAGGGLGAATGGALGSLAGPPGTLLGAIAGGYAGGALGGQWGTGSAIAKQWEQEMAEQASRLSLKNRLGRLLKKYGPIAGVAGLAGLGGYGAYEALSGDEGESFTEEDRLLLEQLRQQQAAEAGE